MITIYCFSGSGHSMTVANALAEMVGCTVRQIDGDSERAADVAVVVFPVYCQNIPKPVKQFLKMLDVKYVALIATYGKMSYGNVLYEAQTLLRGDVIAGAYIPMGHTFLAGDHVFDEKRLQPIAQRVKKPHKAVIPRSRKNPLANLFPGLRSRIGVNIIKGERCNRCGLCERFCPVGAMQNGRIGSGCIRCLRCVTICPQKALQYKNKRILNAYLRHDRKQEYVLYL